MIRNPEPSDPHFSNRFYMNSNFHVRIRNWEQFQELDRFGTRIVEQENEISELNAKLAALQAYLNLVKKSEH